MEVNNIRRDGKVYSKIFFLASIHTCINILPLKIPFAIEWNFFQNAFKKNTLTKYNNTTVKNIPYCARHFQFSFKKLLASIIASFSGCAKISRNRLLLASWSMWYVDKQRQKKVGREIVLQLWQKLKVAPCQTRKFSFPGTFWVLK